VSVQVSGESQVTAGTHGGVTLADLVLIMASGWALPMAVRNALGSGWVLAVAYVVGVVTAIYWTWYCKKLEWFCLSRMAVAGTPPPLRVIVSVYVIVLAGTLLVQYGLYRGLLGSLRT
jgi:hypothetical protein